MAEGTEMGADAEIGEATPLLSNFLSARRGRARVPSSLPMTDTIVTNAVGGGGRD